MTSMMVGATKSFALVAGFATAMAGAAHAGSPAGPTTDAVVPAPVAAAPMARDWTGFYLGGRVGYGDLGSDVGGSDWMAGITAGYLYDMGGWVLGAEANYDWTGIQADVAGTPLGDVDYVGRIGAIVGFATGDLMFFGVAGPAWTKVQNVGSDQGWYGGVGMEYALTNNWRLGGDILYHDFGNFNGTGVDVTATTFALRVNYRF